MPDDEILRRMLALNLERAGAQAALPQGASPSPSAAVPNGERLEKEAKGWKGALVKVTLEDRTVMWRPAAFVYASPEGITWVEPSYADPYGAATPALRTCHGTWLDWNHVQGPDWSALVLESGGRRDADLVGEGLVWFEGWLAEKGLNWQQERERMRRLLEIPSPKGAAKKA